MPNLIMAARAFLARPEQDARMQAALREKAALLGIACPSLAFQPANMMLMPAPPPQFDGAGTLTQGLIRQRFTAIGCTGRSPLFNIWVFAQGDGTALRTIAGYPGTSRADPLLLRDATPVVLAIAARLAPGCATLSVVDTRLIEPAPRDATTPWAENWLVAGCGKQIALTVHFLPDPAGRGTRIEVPDTQTRVLVP